MTFSLAQRLQELPPYLFAELDAKKSRLAAKGMDLINLSIGDPDLPTPAPIVQAMQNALHTPRNHQYPAYNGSAAFRLAACDWMQRHYQVSCNADTECVALIGSKEGIAHLPWAFVNPGDAVLVPDPGYPVYSSSTTFCGGTVHRVLLDPARGFLPDLAAIPRDVAQRAKIFFLNYPNNPTAACAPREFFTELVAFAREHNIILAHDAAYQEIFFDGKRPLSLLQIDGARDVCMEFHSLSKSFNMTGWRLGFAVGNATLVQGLAKMKTNLDSGVFTAVQDAGVVALTTAADCCNTIRAGYQVRRDRLVAALRNIGWPVEAPQATFYVWLRVPTKETAAVFVSRVMETTGVILTPGVGFGAGGEGFVRFALTAPVERLEEAAARIAKVL